MKTYQGSCHCGAVTYDVAGEFREGMRCNCSHCKRKGFLLAFVPESAFVQKHGQDSVTTYHFNKKHIDHQFCNTCGVQSFARGHDGNGNYMVAINLNCLEDFNIDTVVVQNFDGASI